MSVRTDRAVYPLHYRRGLYWVEMEVTVANHLDRTIYFFPECGYGDEPQRRPVRVEGDTTEIWLGIVACFRAGSPTLAIPLPSGETYRARFALKSHESPNAYPPITMKMRTGAFRLIFDMQWTDGIRDRRPVDPIPAEMTTSNVFLVVWP